ncbi:MAG: hypothetical protein IPK00_18665 [Deltaproteobacteria bacterium]|nr:hypothetical protein [Deltaproteobacteria bacterium]
MLASAVACAALPFGIARAASFLPIAPTDTDPDHVVLLGGLSGNGQVAVGQRYCLRNCSDGPFTEAIRWTEAGGFERLGLLPGGTAESGALGIDDDGSHVVGFSDAALGLAAFRWRRDTGMVDLDPGPPAGLDSRFSVAIDVSADSSVVVGYRIVERRVSPDGERTDTITQPFVWTEAGGMRGLEVPDPRGLFNEAHAVSRDGRFVVGSVETLRGVEAFVWDEASGLQTLGGPLAAGFIQADARAVSDDGGTIVGGGAISIDEGPGARARLLFPGGRHAASGGLGVALGDEQRERRVGRRIGRRRKRSTKRARRRR